MSIAVGKNFVPIKAYLRQRPLSKEEIYSKCLNIVRSVSTRNIILKSGLNEKQFSFDHVFGEEASQDEVYSIVVAPMIRHVISGFNCTVFAYGNTGTGKTHTIFGEIKTTLDTNFTVNSSTGLILRVSEQVFSELSKLGSKVEYTVQFSFVEICNEEVRDLLNENLPLRIYDDPLSKGSVCIKDVRKLTVFNSRDVNDWLNVGINDRQNAAANLNLQSSRGHRVVTFFVNIKDLNSKGEVINITGKIELVDLAGSKNTACVGTVRTKELGPNSRSLITLGKVLKALSRKIQHIPFRDSKLTRILQNSLGGNAKTAFIATFSPSHKVWDETIASLDLAQITRTIQNCPEINVNKKQVNLLEELNSEIIKLKEELKAAREREGFYVGAESYQKMMKDVEENNQKIIEMLKHIRQLEEHVRSQDVQHRNLTDSFAKTRHHLETMEMSLKEKQKSVQLEETKMSYMTEKSREVNKTVDILFTVFEDSTKNEAIYHKKYQDKCLTNISNIEIAKKMIETAVEFFKNIENLSEYCSKHTIDHCADIREANDFIQNKNIEDFNQLVELSTEICNLAEETIRNMNNLLDHVNNINRETETFVSSIYENQEQANQLSDLQESIISLNQQLTIKTTEWSEMTNRCFKEFKEDIERRTEKDQMFLQILQNIEKHETERVNNLEEQITMEDQMIELVNKEFEKTEKQEEESTAELQNLQKFIVLIENLRSNESDQDKEKFQIILEYFSAPFPTLYVQKSETGSAMHKMKDMQNNLYNKASHDRDLIGQHVCNMVGIAEEKFEDSKFTFKEVVLDCENQIEELKATALDLATCTDEKLGKSVLVAKDTLLQYGKVIKEVIAKSMDALNQLEKTVDCVGHVGDTPVKKTHNYPKTIASVISPIFLDESKENEDPNNASGN